MAPQAKKKVQDAQPNMWSPTEILKDDTESTLTCTQKGREKLHGIPESQL